MIELLLPFRDLNRPIPANATPRCITKERLKLCWEQALVLLLLLFAPVTCELKAHPAPANRTPVAVGHATRTPRVTSPAPRSTFLIR